MATGIFAADLRLEAAFGSNWQDVVEQNIDFTAAAGQYAYTADASPLDITGDIDLRVWVAMDDWTPTATQALLAKWTASGDQRSYALQINSTGNLQLQWSTDGTSGGILTATSTGTVTQTNGSWWWVRATLDVSVRTVTFYRSEDGFAWTQIDTVSGAATSIFASSAQLQIGAKDTANRLAGNVRRAQVYNGIAGTLAFDANFTDPIILEPGDGSFIEQSTNQATVTINGGTVANPWTDITAYVRNIEIRRGRSYELNRFEAGQMTVTLDNADRRFEPLFTSGAYNPNVVPRVPIRLRGAYANFGYGIWRGFVDSWPQTWPGGGLDATCVIECVDGFGVLAMHGWGESYTAKVTQDIGAGIHFPLWESSGTTVDNVGWVGEVVDATYVGSPTLDLDGPITFSKSVGLNGSSQYVFDATVLHNFNTLSWTMGLWFKADVGGAMTLFSATNTTQEALYIQANTTANTIIMTGEDAASGTTTVTWPVTLNTGTWYHLVVSFDAGTMIAQVWVNGTWEGWNDVRDIMKTELSADLDNDEWFLGVKDDGKGTKSAYWDGNLSSFTVWHEANGGLLAAQANRDADALRPDSTDDRLNQILDATSWPAPYRNLDAATVSELFVTYDVGSALEMMRRTVASDEGRVFMDANGCVRYVKKGSRAAASVQKTFGESNARYSEVALDYDVHSVFNRVILTGPTASATANDATSQQAYGLRTLKMDIDLGASDLAALATSLITRYKDPGLRIPAITIQPEYDAADLYPQVLGREISDKITVKRTPPGGGAEISRDVFIESISHSISPQDGWYTTWELSPAT